MNEIVKEFYVARAEAINAYAIYEQHLGLLYSELLRVPPVYAAYTFFEINNAPARINILGKMLTQRHGDTYDKFWTPLKGKLKAISEDRNRIVHWMVFQKNSGAEIEEVVLIPSNIFDSTERTKEISLQDLNNFRERCESYTALLAKFRNELSQLGERQAA